MLDPVSVGLKFAFLAVLYLFLLWVAWSALRDLRRGGRGGGKGGNAVADGRPPDDATSMFEAAALHDLQPFEPRLFVVRAPGHEPGAAYDLSRGATLGRAEVEIQLEDPFASAHHARIVREGDVAVIEDLGSTNGTYLNDEPLSGPQPLHSGDRIRIGGSEFSYRQ